MRSRAAAIKAATQLFLQNGFQQTTMDAVAEHAGLTKRTLYNNYSSKADLFRAAVDDMISYAQRFASELDEAFFDEMASDPPKHLVDLGRRLADAIMIPPVISLRRLLISQGDAFPDLAEEYFDRTPGRVLRSLEAGFIRLGDAGVLSIDDARIASEQFAYLVVGASLDRAVVTGRLPPKAVVVQRAEAGARTFLAHFLLPRNQKGPTQRTG